MKDFTFSDGTTVPAGNLVSIAVPCIHTDSVKMHHYYPNFDLRVCAYRRITSTLKSLTAYALKRCEGKRVKHNPSTHSSPSIPISYCSGTAVMRGKHIFSLSPVINEGWLYIYRSPGRLFAANVLKMMLCHILLNYDVKMASGGGRPADMWFGRFSSPNTKADVLFRKRVWRGEWHVLLSILDFIWLLKLRTYWSHWISRICKFLSYVAMTTKRDVFRETTVAFRRYSSTHSRWGQHNRPDAILRE